MHYEMVITVSSVTTDIIQSYRTTDYIPCDVHYALP